MCNNKKYILNMWKSVKKVYFNFFRIFKYILNIFASKLLTFQYINSL